MKKLFSKVKESKGFTLVEMIVVMAIIGILVALLAPNVATLIRDAQDTTNDAKVKNVMTTLGAYNTKMIKDGYIFQKTADIELDAAIPGDDAVVVTVTGATGMDTDVKALWKTNAGTVSTTTFVGNASGYLPSNILNDTEVMHFILSREGTVLGVVYTDATGVVKAATSTLKVGDGPLAAAGATAGDPYDSSTTRNLTTTDGLACN